MCFHLCMFIWLTLAHVFVEHLRLIPSDSAIEGHPEAANSSADRSTCGCDVAAIPIVALTIVPIVVRCLLA